MGIDRLKLLALAACCFVFCMGIALSGVAQVDVTGALVGNGSYATLGAAFTAINGGALGGASIVINIVGNTNEGTGSATLNQSASPWATLTIQPSGGAWTIAGATTAGTPLIDLIGADNVAIDGLNTSGNSLTISNSQTSSTGGTGTIRFRNDATNNVITRCSIQGSSTVVNTSTGGTIFFGTGTTIGNDNNTISFCNIGPAGANLPRQAIMGFGSIGSTTQYNSGNQILNCNIFDFFAPTVASNGIYSNAGNTAWTISNNRFYQTATRTQTTGSIHTAIQFNNTTGNEGSLISGNTIGFASSAGTGTYTLVGSGTASHFFPIYIANAATNVSNSIQGNTIQNISFSGTVSGNNISTPFAAIMVDNGKADIGTVTGNVIGSSTSNNNILFSSSAGSLSDVYGIYYDVAQSATIANNQIGGFGLNQPGSSHIVFYGIRVTSGGSNVNTIEGNTVGYATATITNTAFANQSRAIGILSENGASQVSYNDVGFMSVLANNTGTANSASMIGILANNIIPSSSNTIAHNSVRVLDQTNSSAATFVIGIGYLGTNSAGSTVSHNVIHSLSSASSAGTLQGISAWTGSASYFNNTVRLGYNSAGASITLGLNIMGFEEQGATNHFYHNSVYIGGTGVLGANRTYAFRSSVTSAVREIENNIFFNARSNASGTGKHHAITIGGAVPNIASMTCDYNDLAATGSGGTVGLFAGSGDLLTLADWQLATGKDINSFSQDPNYVNPTGSAATVGLHINGTSPIEGVGIAVAAVTDDVDGQARAGLTPVDVGADAGNFVLLDQTPPVITYTSGTNCTTGDFTFTATITDFTGVPTSGAFQPRVYYRKNNGGLQSVQGTLSSGTAQNGTWSFTILASSMGGMVLGDIVSYFVIAQDMGGYVRSNPVLGLVASDVNTVTTPPNSIYKYGAMAGTYTVGVGGFYPTLTAAVAAYNTSCLGGPVLFSLIDATYPSETFPININANTFASAVNTLTIKPTLANTVIGASSGTAIVKLNAANFIIIDGSIGSTTNSSCVPIATASRDLSFTNTSTASATAVIWLSSAGAGLGATNNIVKNCILSNGVDQSITTTDNYDIVSCGATITTFPPPDGLSNNSNTFENNALLKANWGIYLRGGAVTSNMGNTIRQNLVGPATFGSNQLRKGGIIVQHQDGVIINANEVRCVGDQLAQTIVGTDHIGIGIGGADGPSPLTSNVTNASVTHNTVHDIVSEKTSSAIGIQLGANNGSATNNLVANNMIYNIRANGTFGEQGIGINAASGNGDKIVFNSISMVAADRDPGAATSATESDIGVRFQSSAFNPMFMDNVIYMDQASNTSTVKNFAVVAPPSANPWGTGASNYNDYVVNTGNTQNVLFGRGTIGVIPQVATLAAWRTTFTPNQDANSLTVVPVFTSPTDLHLVPSLNAALNDLGSTVAGVTTDIDCDTRSVTTPDMGADEFSTSVPIINYTLLSQTCNTGDMVFTATITDAEGVPTTGALQPRVYFKKNAGSYFSTQGVLSSGSGTNGTWTFTISAAAMGGLSGGDVISYFVIAQDIVAIPNLVANPAVGLVASDVNSVTTPPTTPNTVAITMTLNGTYTVGAAGDFITLTAAVNAYNNGCMSGPVLFSLIDAAYPSETFPITINASTYASAINTLTIKPTLANTVISASSTTSIIKLNGANFIILDGSIVSTTNSSCAPIATASRDLSLTNTSTASATAVIWLSSAGAGLGATNNTVKNCILSNGVDQSITATDNYDIVSCGATITTFPPPDGLSNNSNTFENNALLKANWGIYLRGAVASSNTGNVIRQNLVGPASFGNTQLRKGGIIVQHQNGVLINANEVRFVGNQVAQVVAGTDHVGIGIGGADGPSPLSSNVTNASVTHNTVHDIVCEKTFSAIGIELAATNASATNNLVANNMIYNIRANGTFGEQGIGINAASGNGDQIVFNSINMVAADRDHGAATAANESDIGVRFQSSALNPMFMDNVIYMDQASNTLTVKNFAVVAPSSTNPWGTGTSNYNDYVVNTVNTQNVLFGRGTTGAIPQVATLAAWRTTYTPNQDANSMTVAPVFVSPTDLHLVPASNALLNDLGTTVPGVTTDIDCATRSVTTPDMGVDEFSTSVPVISYTLLPQSCDTGDIVFTANITDLEGVPTTGLLQPRVYFKKNAGSYFSTQGVLSSGTGTNGTWTFTISAAAMGGLSGGEVISCFVIAQDIVAIPNIVSNPAAGLVALDVNTVTTPPTNPTTTTVVITLNGTYTVGVGGNFTTLTAAVNAYNNYCLAGPVVFSLINATYPSETFPININANAYASAINTLTIKPAPGVSSTLTTNTTNTIIAFNGADYVTVDGSNGTVVNSICPRDTATRNLTIRNTSVAGPVICKVGFFTIGGNAATNNRLINCRVLGTGLSVHNGGPTVGSGTGANGNNNNQVINNALQNDVFFSGTAAVRNQNNEFSLNFMQGALTLFYENAPTIHANLIRYLFGGGDVIAINLGFNAGFSSSETTGQVVSNASVMYNRLDYIESQTRNSACGICVAATPTGTTTIANNFVNRVSTDPTFPDIGVGIFWGGGSGTFRAWYNTVSMITPLATGLSSTQPIMAIGVNGSTPNLDIRNNMLHVNGSDYNNTTSINLGYTSTPGNYANLTSNYNDLAPTGTSGYCIGRTLSLDPSGINYFTLNSWQTQTGRDQNSINVLPNFVSAADLHLPAASNAAIVDRGTPIVLITTDIDCELRDPVTPDIGADESNVCVTADGGTISTGTTSYCGSTTVTLTSTGYSLGQGGSFVWQSSPAGLNTWTNTGGTNPASFTSGVITASTDFRLRASCVTNSSVDSSNVITVTINPITNPSVTIIASPGNSICPSASVTFTATATNSGTAPTYQWKLNGANVGTNSATYVNATLVNGDQVTCVVTSNAPCPVPNSVTSNVITMTVGDATAPIAICQNLTVTLDALGNGTVTPASANNGSSDNCTLSGLLTFSIANAAFTCNDLGSNTRTLAVTDASGNTGTCGLTVSVVDAMAPNAICQNLTVALDINGNANPTAAQVNNGSTDNCTTTNLLSMSLSGTSFTCANVGINLRTLTVSDGQGNSSTCTATIQVIDNLGPVATCQNVTVQLNGAGFASISPPMVLNSASDNCTPPNALIFSASPTDFVCANLGTNTVTLAITDQHGNTATCAASVTLVDTIAPLAHCQNTSVTLDPLGNSSLSASTVNNGSQDNCSLTVSLSPTTFNCADVGNNLVTLTVTDGSGNSSLCNAIVAVTDASPPVALCQNITVSLGPNGNVSITPNAVDNGSSDVCGIGSITINQNFFDCGDQGANPVVLTVVDSSGNSASCTAIVTVPSLSTSIAVAADVMDCGYNLSCHGASDGVATVSGSGCPPMTYLWSTGAATPTVTGLAAGTYTVTITDGSGAFVTDTITLIDPPLLQATLGVVQPSCAGNPTGSADIIPTGGNACHPYTYLWSNGDTTEDLATAAPANYMVIVTDAQGCTAMQAVTIGSLPAPTPTFTQVGHQLVAGQPWTTYQWLLNGFPLSGANSSVYDILVQGSYSLQVTDSNGCLGTASPYVVVGIEEALTGWTVFPNPARDRCLLETIQPAVAGTTVRMTDMLGRTMLEQAFPVSETRLEIDLRRCAAGIYWLEVATSEGGRKAFRLVVE
jgi:hypothetical protein